MKFRQAGKSLSGCPVALAQNVEVVFIEIVLRLPNLAQKDQGNKKESLFLKAAVLAPSWYVQCAWQQHWPNPQFP